MVAKGEHDLMANRSDRSLHALVFVRAPFHEAARMIGEAGARISIMATGTLDAPQQAEYMTATASLRLSHPCTRAGSIYDRKSNARSAAVPFAQDDRTNLSHSVILSGG